MRILALVPDAFGGHGGISVYNSDFLQALSTHPDCEEVVAIPRLMPNSPGDVPAPIRYVTSGLNSKIKYFATVVKTLLQSPRFDLIVCGHINLLPLAFLARFFSKAPVVLEIYGIDAWQPTASALVNRLSAHVDAFVSISEITRQRFLSWSKAPAERGFILPNAIHMERYGMGEKRSELLARYGLEGKTVLMTFGRLVSHERGKGFDEVLEILPKLAEQVPNIAYLIAGKGDDRERLEDKVHALGLGDRVVFTGYIAEQEKADIYRLADVYVMPSRGEGFGFVFLEAMACGIPVVASAVDGSREAVLDGQLGKIVDPDSPAEITSAILHALSQEKMIDKGLEHFSMANFSVRLHKIVDQINSGLAP